MADAESAEKDTVFGGTTIPVDASKDATDGFGPLKALLEAIPVTYANHEVRSSHDPVIRIVS